MTSTGVTALDKAIWICAADAESVSQPDEGSVLLRRTFTVPKDLRFDEVRVHVLGLGFYELTLNGQKVGADELSPMHGNVGRRLVVDQYELAADLLREENVLGLELAHGYGVDFFQYGFRWLGSKQAILALTAYAGPTPVYEVVTDTEWVSAPGPVCSNSIYEGEIHDARREVRGWNVAGFHAEAWPSVRPAPEPEAQLVFDEAPRIRVVDQLVATACDSPSASRTVYDLGRNIAGRVRVKCHGGAGGRVVVRTAEELHLNGQLDTRTNGRARAIDEYVLRGDPDGETWAPRFTYHGFRFFEVEAAGVKIDQVLGEELHASMAVRATFSCSDGMLNAVWANSLSSIAANSMGTPTDTPVRAERTPPAMDVYASVDTAALAFDSHAYYGKYLRDLPPGTALPTDDGNAHLPDMAGGQVVLPWVLYREFGEPGLLHEQFEAMMAFVRENAQRSDLVWPDDIGFGDWCAPDASATTSGGLQFKDADHDNGRNRGLVNTALSYEQAVNVARAARVLGKDAEGLHLETIAGEIRDAFARAYPLDHETIQGAGGQLRAILALSLGLVADKERTHVAASLEHHVRRTGHLDIGIFGARHVFYAFDDPRQLDCVLDAMRAPTYPSFAWQIERGATTLWEQWVYDAPMQTHNHAMFAGIAAPMVTRLAGLRPSAPGYRDVEVQPVLVPSLDWVSASVQTPLGMVTSRWERHGDTVTILADAPSRINLRVLLPTGTRLLATNGDRESETSYRLEPGSTRLEVTVAATGEGAQA